MDYRELTEEQQLKVLRGRLAQLEEHHYRVGLDREDAEAVGDDVTLVASLEKLAVVETQITNTLGRIEEMTPKKRSKK